MRDATTGDSIITGCYAWPPIASWRPKEAAFPPSLLSASCNHLKYQKTSSPGAPPIRPERHNPASITTQKAVQARNLINTLQIGRASCRERAKDPLETDQ